MFSSKRELLNMETFINYVKEVYKIPISIEIKNNIIRITGKYTKKFEDNILNIAKKLEDYMRKNNEYYNTFNAIFISRKLSDINNKNTLTILLRKSS